LRRRRRRRKKEDVDLVYCTHCISKIEAIAIVVSLATK
jgi:hypothetical protein